MNREESALRETPSELLSSSESSVCVIIVHYNCLSDTLRCLESLRRLNYKKWTAIVVDGGSSDDSGSLLSNRVSDPRVDFLTSPENGGFASSNNIGLHLARARGADYIWLLNPDTTVRADTLDSLLSEVSYFPQGVICGSKILYGAERSHTIWGAGGFLDVEHQQISMRGTDEIDNGQYDSSENCDYIPGCSMFFPTSVLDRIGFMPEEFFMYFEETEWCARASSESIPLRYVPQSVVFHHFADEKMQKPFCVYYFNRNQRLFWWRQISFLRRIRLLLRVALKELPTALRALWSASEAEQRSIFKAHRDSCLDFLFGRFGFRSKSF